MLADLTLPLYVGRAERMNNMGVRRTAMIGSEWLRTESTWPFVHDELTITKAACRNEKEYRYMNMR